MAISIQTVTSDNPVNATGGAVTNSAAFLVALLAALSAGGTSASVHNISGTDDIPSHDSKSKGGLAETPSPSDNDNKCEPEQQEVGADRLGLASLMCAQAAVQLQRILKKITGATPAPGAPDVSPGDVPNTAIERPCIAELARATDAEAISTAGAFDVENLNDHVGAPHLARLERCQSGAGAGCHDDLDTVNDAAGVSQKALTGAKARNDGASSISRLSLGSEPALLNPNSAQASSGIAVAPSVPAEGALAITDHETRRERRTAGVATHEVTPRGSMPMPSAWRIALSSAEISTSGASSLSVVEGLTSAETEGAGNDATQGITSYTIDAGSLLGFQPSHHGSPDTASGATSANTNVNEVEPNIHNLQERSTKEQSLPAAPADPAETTAQMQDVLSPTVHSEAVRVVTAYPTTSGQLDGSDRIATSIARTPTTKASDETRRNTAKQKKHSAVPDIQQRITTEEVERQAGTINEKPTHKSEHVSVERDMQHASLATGDHSDRQSAKPSSAQDLTSAGSVLAVSHESELAEDKLAADPKQELADDGVLKRALVDMPAKETFPGLAGTDGLGNMPPISDRESSSTDRVAEQNRADVPSALRTALAREPENAYRQHATSMIERARLLEHMGKSEMHIALHAPEAGQIKVHASVHDGRLEANIAIEKAEVRNAVAADLPNLEKALGHRSVEPVHVAVLDTATTGFAGGDSRRHQQPSHPNSAMPRHEANVADTTLDSFVQPLTALSVHA